MAHEEFVLNSGGTLHRVTRDDYGVKPHEGEKLDDAGGAQRFTDQAEAEAAAKRLCSRCFPNADKPAHASPPADTGKGE